MKRIEAVIKPFKLDPVKEALSRLGIEGLTVFEVRGFGRQKGRPVSYRGTEYAVDFVPKIKIELVLPDHLADSAVQGILAAARTGEIGDGKIFVSDLEDVVRVRTGERGRSAL